jgi:O-antigen ligase
MTEFRVAPSAVTAPETAEIDEEGILVSENVQGTLSQDLRTLNGRTVIWNSALQAVRDNRQLFLWGTEYIGTVVSVYNPFPVEHGHNSWVEVLLRSGLPGLVMALAFTGMAVISAAKLLLNMETELWKKVIAMTTICVMGTGFLEPSLFGGKSFYHVIDFLFFFCTGYLDYWCRPKKYQ